MLQSVLQVISRKPSREIFGVSESSTARRSFTGERGKICTQRGMATPPTPRMVNEKARRRMKRKEGRTSLRVEAKRNFPRHPRNTQRVRSEGLAQTHPKRQVVVAPAMLGPKRDHSACTYASYSAGSTHVSHPICVKNSSSRVLISLFDTPPMDE